MIFWKRDLNCQSRLYMKKDNRHSALELAQWESTLPNNKPATSSIPYLHFQKCFLFCENQLHLPLKLYTSRVYAVSLYRDRKFFFVINMSSFPSEPVYSEKYGWQIAISPQKKLSVRKVCVIFYWWLVVARYDFNRFTIVLGS